MMNRDFILLKVQSTNRMIKLRATSSSPNVLSKPKQKFSEPHKDHLRLLLALKVSFLITLKAK